MSFNNHLDFFHNRFTGVDVQLGFETTITLTSVEHNTTDAFREMDLEQRKCKFSHEQDDEDSIFKHYTQRGLLNKSVTNLLLVS